MSDRAIIDQAAVTAGALDASDLVDVIVAAMDVVLQLAPDGRVLEAQSGLGPKHSALIQGWVGQDFRETLTVESVPKFEAALTSLQSSRHLNRGIELNHKHENQSDFPVRYSFFTPKNGSTIVLVGRDLSSISEVQQHLVNVQIELERDYEAHRDADTRFRVLLEGTQEAVLFVSCSTGRVTSLNKRAASLLGGDKANITGQAIAQEFDGRRRGELIDALTSAALSDPAGQISLKARRSQATLSVAPHLFRIDNERMLLCRISSPSVDATPIATETADRMAALFDQGPDAILFVDSSGQILSGNEAFLSLVEVPHLSGLRGRSISDYFARGSIDMKAILDNTMKSGALPLYATHMSSDLGNDVPVEISTSLIDNDNHPILAMILRDARRAEAVWRPNGGAQTSDMRSVMELVGSTTLKKIVADTTDMVEKMCIETAVELTRNNRVAAAEMLGLSRQSLYVKLRKYGLLSKDKD